MKIDFKFEDPVQNIGFLLWQTTMQWQRQMNRELEQVELTHTQFVILIALAWLLKTSKDVTQKDIADHSKADNMMVSKILRNLQNKGLIERKEHSIDTRAKCVTMTDKGFDILQRAIEIKTKANKKFFKNLSNTDSFKKELENIISK